MSRFSIPTVLKRVPRELLAQFFESYGHKELVELCGEPQPVDSDQILLTMEDLEPEQYDALEAGLHEVCDLACESGTNALIEAAFESGHFDFASELPDRGWYHKSMWCLVHYKSIFVKALLIHEIGGYSFWRKRTDLPQRPVVMDDRNRKELRNGISDVFMQYQGRGKQASVFSVSRKGIDFVIVYLDDFLMDVQFHDEQGRLTPGSMRPTFQVVFAFNPSEGSLEVYAPKVPAKVKSQLEQVFAWVFLEVHLPPWNKKAAYELDHLKDRSYSLATDPEDAICIRISKMRLSSLCGDRRIILDAGSAGKLEDVHEMMEDYLNAKEFPKSHFHITQATLRFEFLALPERKSGSATFDVTWPSSCGVRTQRPELVAIIQKYLKRWKIDRSESIAPTAVEN
ncbi:MAG: hypothetical protein O2856_05600 [Planctomycetota bacterium]|nr:hypothetical protein [Planctomycetota bacterium]